MATQSWQNSRAIILIATGAGTLTFIHSPAIPRIIFQDDKFIEKGDPMYTLRIEHSVNDFASWKRLFDLDPIGRKKMGVRRYRILRPVDDLKCVIIFLEFEQMDQAKASETALRQLLAKVEGTVMTKPKLRILEIVEAKEL